MEGIKQLEDRKKIKEMLLEVCDLIATDCDERNCEDCPVIKIKKILDERE